MLACCQQASPPSTAVADLVLINGNIVTVDNDLPHAAALAMAGDRIVAVGSNDEIGAYIGDITDVIDLRGQTAIPGLIEGHGHFTSFGGSLMTLDFRYSRSFEDIVSMVAGVAETTPAGHGLVRAGLELRENPDRG